MRWDLLGWIRRKQQPQAQQQAQEQQDVADREFDELARLFASGDTSPEVLDRIGHLLRTWKPAGER